MVVGIALVRTVYCVSPILTRSDGNVRVCALVETHFALPGRGNLDQPAAQGEALERAAEHDAANQIEDDVRAFSSVAARTSAGRSSAPTIGFSAMARIGAFGAGGRRWAPITRAPRRRAIWAAALPTPPPAPIKSTISPDFRPAASMPHQAAM
jgi:hypothetical protein